MIEILLVLLLVMPMAAHRKKRRRYNPNFRAVPIQSSVALGTLGAGVLIGADLLAASDSDFYAISIDLSWSINGLTAGEGPIEVGLAHGDYTDAEVEAYIEESAQLTRGNLIAKEVMSRKVRTVGTFAPGATTEAVLQNGMKVRTKLGWQVTTGETIRVWARNPTSGALTTGAAVSAIGKFYIRWT